MAKGLMWKKFDIIAYGILGLGLIYIGIDFIVDGEWLFGLVTLPIGLYYARRFWKSVIGKEE